MAEPKLPRFRGKRSCDGPGYNDRHGNPINNNWRADRAERGLLSYIGEDKPYYPEHIQDLLSDLMHLACRERLDYEEMLRRARCTYEQER